MCSYIIISFHQITIELGIFTYFKVLFFSCIDRFLLIGPCRLNLTQSTFLLVSKVVNSMFSRPFHFAVKEHFKIILLPVTSRRNKFLDSLYWFVRSVFLKKKNGWNRKRKLGQFYFSYTKEPTLEQVNKKTYLDKCYCDNNHYSLKTNSSK